MDEWTIRIFKKKDDLKAVDIDEEEIVAPQNTDHAVTSILDDKWDLEFNEISSHEVYAPSAIVGGTFTRINDEVKSDFRTKLRLKEKLFLGYSIDEIRANVIERGIANFGEGFSDDISSEDKVLLYCYFNMKKHVCTSAQLYKSLGNLERYFTQSDKKPLIIDLGCGPATSLLAMSDIVHTMTGEPVNLNYIGVDTAEAMLKRGQKIITESNLLDNKSKVMFHANWNDLNSFIHSKLAETNLIIFNASYLFASKNLDIYSLSRFVVGLNRRGVDSYFINQNPPLDEHSNQRFIEFKQIVSSFEMANEQDLILNCSYAQNSNYAPQKAEVRFTVLKRNG